MFEKGENLRKIKLKKEISVYIDLENYYGESKYAEETTI